MIIDIEQVERWLENEQQTVNNWDAFSFDHELTRAQDTVSILKKVLRMVKDD